MRAFVYNVYISKTLVISNKRMNKTSITVDGVEYAPVSQLAPAKTKKGLTYCIVRTYSAGVVAGYVDLKKVGKVMVVKEARQLYRWWSEFTLVALATKGIKPGKEKENKYSMPAEEMILTEVIQVIPCTKVAQEQISSHPNYSE